MGLRKPCWVFFSVFLASSLVMKICIYLITSVVYGIQISLRFVEIGSYYEIDVFFPINLYLDIHNRIFIYNFMQ